METNEDKGVEEKEQETTPEQKETPEAEEETTERIEEAVEEPLEAEREEEEAETAEETTEEKEIEEETPEAVKEAAEEEKEEIEAPEEEELKEVERERERKEEGEEEIVEERIYTIPLRRAWISPRKKRAPRAVRIVKSFIQRHMKPEVIVVSNEVNQKLWSRGIEKPPRNIRVRASKDKEGTVTLRLAEGD